MKRTELTPGVEYALVSYKPKHGLPPKSQVHRVRFIEVLATYEYQEWAGWGHSEKRTRIGTNGIKVVYLDGQKKTYPADQWEIEPGGEVTLKSAAKLWTTWDDYAAKRDEKDAADAALKARMAAEEDAYVRVATRLRTQFGFDDFRNDHSDRFVMTPGALEALIEKIESDVHAGEVTY